MPRWKEPPPGFVCPYKDHCPYLEGLSTYWVFAQYQRGFISEHEHWRTREEMSDEINGLLKTVDEQARQIDQLQAENKRLHQQKFKPRNNKSSIKPANEPGAGRACENRRRGAPKGHPPWSRKLPDRIDRIVEVDMPDCCPHCQAQTDVSKTDITSFIQEDIVLRPQTVVTRYNYTRAWCPKCRRPVTRKPLHELPFAPVGPQAKAAALYLRHDLKLPYRKIQQLMSTLFGVELTPSSILGFEERARKNADPLYEDLILNMRSSDLVHADETYWREDGENKVVWYAGNEDVAVFHIDAHRSSEAAGFLLGEEVQGLLVTDGYAAYNVIKALGRQSCLAHLLRRSHELKLELEAMKQPDAASIRFCSTLAQLFKYACNKTIPSRKRDRKALKARLLRALDLICEKPLVFPKAETLRKRLIPGAREYDQLFSFIEFQGPPTNNHAERALRPLVIFRKVCMGTRSQKGSENISVFSSLSQTAKLQNTPILNLFVALLTGSTTSAQNTLFNNSS